MANITNLFDSDYSAIYLRSDLCSFLWYLTMVRSTSVVVQYIWKSKLVEILITKTENIYSLKDGIIRGNRFSV